LIQALGHRPLLLAQRVEVRSDKLATVTVDAGIRVAAADWVPALDPTHGWWGVIRSGDRSPRRLGRADDWDD
jgi:hypothetical protein